MKNVYNPRPPARLLKEWIRSSGSKHDKRNFNRWIKGGSGVTGKPTKTKPSAPSNHIEKLNSIYNRLNNLFTTGNSIKLEEYRQTLEEYKRDQMKNLIKVHSKSAEALRIAETAHKRLTDNMSKYSNPESLFDKVNEKTQILDLQSNLNNLETRIAFIEARVVEEGYNKPLEAMSFTFEKQVFPGHNLWLKCIVVDEKTFYSGWRKALFPYKDYHPNHIVEDRQNEGRPYYHYLYCRSFVVQNKKDIYKKLTNIFTESFKSSVSTDLSTEARNAAIISKTQTAVREAWEKIQLFSIGPNSEKDNACKFKNTVSCVEDQWKYLTVDYPRCYTRLIKEEKLLNSFKEKVPHMEERNDKSVGKPIPGLTDEYLYSRLRHLLSGATNKKEKILREHGVESVAKLYNTHEKTDEGDIIKHGTGVFVDFSTNLEVVDTEDNTSKNSNYESEKLTLGLYNQDGLLITQNEMNKVKRNRWPDAVGVWCGVESFINNKKKEECKYPSDKDAHTDWDLVKRPNGSEKSLENPAYGAEGPLKGNFEGFKRVYSKDQQKLNELLEKQRLLLNTLYSNQSYWKKFFLDVQEDVRKTLSQSKYDTIRDINTKDFSDNEYNEKQRHLWLSHSDNYGILIHTFYLSVNTSSNLVDPGKAVPFKEEEDSETICGFKKLKWNMGKGKQYYKWNQARLGKEFFKALKDQYNGQLKLDIEQERMGDKMVKRDDDNNLVPTYSKPQVYPPECRYEYRVYVDDRPNPVVENDRMCTYEYLNPQKLSKEFQATTNAMVADIHGLRKITPRTLMLANDIRRMFTWDVQKGSSKQNMKCVHFTSQSVIKTEQISYQKENEEINANNIKLKNKLKDQHDQNAEKWYDLAEQIKSKGQGKYSKLERLALLLGTMEMEVFGQEDLKEKVYTIIDNFLENPFTGKAYLNFILSGPAGIGKTYLSAKIAELFVAAGILVTNNVRIAGAADLIGQYMGQTAPKTIGLLQECMQGVLFIDEAYTLVSGGEDNSYGAESVGAMLPFLSDNKGTICVIAAGYKKEMEGEFLNSNPGLPSRFPHQITLSRYNPLTTLRMIVQKFNSKWRGSDKYPEIGIENNKDGTQVVYMDYGEVKYDCNLKSILDFLNYSLKQDDSRKWEKMQDWKSKLSGGKATEMWRTGSNRIIFNDGADVDSSEIAYEQAKVVVSKIPKLQRHSKEEGIEKWKIRNLIFYAEGRDIDTFVETTLSENLKKVNDPATGGVPPKLYRFSNHPDNSPIGNFISKCICEYAITNMSMLIEHAQMMQCPMETSNCEDIYKISYVESDLKRKALEYLWNGSNNHEIPYNLQKDKTMSPIKLDIPQKSNENVMNTGEGFLKKLLGQNIFSPR